ncbi:MAG: DUF3782 protein [Magnetococcales bacterium]|nr:DUF3782 protein [Magnetococcales bacterium]HIJ84993.1 hypothetical protein [Magnetococcales bacterium]
MSQTVTIDDIWKLFQETNRLFQESEREMQDLKRKSEQEMQDSKRKSEQEMQDSKREWESKREQSKREWEQSKREWDRRFQESREKSDRDFEETRRILRESGEETDRRFQETERVVKEVSRQIGQLGSRWGEFVEKMIAPACIDMFTKRGIQVDEVFSRARKNLDGQNMEIDLLVANTVAAVLVEVKSNLRVEDVRDHLERLKKFKRFFPRYADCTVYGAVAGIVIDADADQFAMNRGLFVIAQSGETVRIANDESFVPKTW